MSRTLLFTCLAVLLLYCCMLGYSCALSIDTNKVRCGGKEKCLPDCSGHGTFDPEKGICYCLPGYGGLDCAQALICDPPCENPGFCHPNSQGEGNYCLYPK